MLIIKKIISMEIVINKRSLFDSWIKFSGYKNEINGIKNNRSPINNSLFLTSNIIIKKLV